VVLGCLARSVRDAARFYDVCAGYHPADPSSLPSSGAWERDLGSYELAGRRVAVLPALGGVSELTPDIEHRVRDAAKTLVDATGLVEVDLELDLPNLSAQWMMGNLSTLVAELGDRWPACASELTAEVATGLYLAQALYNLRTAAVAEEMRLRAYHVMADAFEHVDFIIAATNPDVAFAADAATSNTTNSFVDTAGESAAARAALRAALGFVRFAAAAFPKLPSTLLDFGARRFPDLVSMGALTIISNICGNPAVSIPAGLVGGLPVGMQLLTRHHADALLFDVALAAERVAPWPLVASPRVSSRP
jgi:aspartyl-tRNA(Asn)/glutamyl-tRNA(Gln) amidotransferase subunit A